MLAGLGQDFLRTVAAVFVLSGYFQRTRWKYHVRHYRYVCWEAGHIAQNLNLYLVGEAAELRGASSERSSMTPSTICWEWTGAKRLRSGSSPSGLAETR